MSNKKRRCEPNLTYHTYSRCADKSTMMKSDHMKNLMLTVIVMAQERYSFDLISYVIMDNHFHFIIRTVENGAPISRIMQFIKAQFAKRYNKKMNKTGPFWNERYGDTIIEEQEFPEEAFNNINSYIINNPVKANYVNDARDYKYSCIHFYIDENYISPVKLTFHEYYLKLGSSFRQRADRFLDLGRLQLLRVF
jgi:putative transposase